MNLQRLLACNLLAMGCVFVAICLTVWAAIDNSLLGTMWWGLTIISLTVSAVALGWPRK